MPKREGLDGEIPFLSVQFSPDGRLLAAGALEEDRNAYVWEVESWLHRDTYLDHYTGVYGLAFSDDGSVLATASGLELRLYDIESSEMLHQITYDDIAIYSLNFIEDLLVFSGIHGIPAEVEEPSGIYTWDISKDEQPQLIYDAFYIRWFSTIDTDPNQRDIIAFTTPENGIALFDLTTDTIIGIFGMSDYPIWSMDFHPDGGRLVVSSQDDKVRIWSLCQ